MSIAQRAGLSEGFQTTLLILTVVLALTPYLADVSIGILKIPKLSMRQRRSMKIAGPLAVAAAIALVAPLLPAPTLRLLAADVTGAGEIDVAVANDGAKAALLTKIELEILDERDARVRPVLLPTATYTIPIGALSVGARRGLAIRHLLPPLATERIVIAPVTNRSMDVRLRIFTSQGVVLKADVRMWPEAPER